MRTNKQTNKQGFTLVELSIVLVIIGMLIGGILVAQSLIESAKISRLVRDIGQYEAAIKLFKSNYRTYPGDSSYFSPPGAPNNRFWTGDTDGDGAENATLCNGALSNHEIYQLWAHLSQAGMLDKNYEAYSPTTNCGGPHAGYNDISSAGVVAPYYDTSESLAISQNKYPISIHKYTASQNLRMDFAFFAPLDGLALESKMGSTDGSGKQVGLVNTYGVGMCLNSSLSGLVGCADPTAHTPNLYYYIAP